MQTKLNYTYTLTIEEERGQSWQQDRQQIRRARLQSELTGTNLNGFSTGTHAEDGRRNHGVFWFMFNSQNIV
jgi:hypothetical protein